MNSLLIILLVWIAAFVVSYFVSKVFFQGLVDFFISRFNGK